MFLKTCAMERAVFKKIKEDCNASYVKTIAWSVAVKEVTNTLVFYIFEYGAEYIAEFSAQSSPK